MMAATGEMAQAFEPKAAQAAAVILVRVVVVSRVRAAHPDPGQVPGAVASSATRETPAIDHRQTARVLPLKVAAA